MARSTFDYYINRINLAFSEMPQGSVDEALSLLSETVDSNNRIWVAGNGGSAATASHFATDLSRCNNSSGDPVKGMSLCDNSGLITAIGNDFGFDQIFFRQLSNAAVKGELLIVISASEGTISFSIILKGTSKFPKKSRSGSPSNMPFLTNRFTNRSSKE